MGLFRSSKKTTASNNSNFGARRVRSVSKLFCYLDRSIRETDLRSCKKIDWFYGSISVAWKTKTLFVFFVVQWKLTCNSRLPARPLAHHIRAPCLHPRCFVDRQEGRAAAKTMLITKYWKWWSQKLRNMIKTVLLDLAFNNNRKPLLECAKRLTKYERIWDISEIFIAKMFRPTIYFQNEATEINIVCLITWGQLVPCVFKHRM